MSSSPAEPTAPAAPLLGEEAVDAIDDVLARWLPESIGGVDISCLGVEILIALEPPVAVLVAEREQEAYSRGVNEGAVAENRTREQIAREIEFTAERQAKGELPRPRFERGGFLNDWAWAAQVARRGAS